MVRLSEILEHDAPHLGITNRRQLLAFYDAVKTALREGLLTPAGGALPSSLNELLALLPGDLTLAKRDRELTDWSVDNDAQYAAFLTSWRTRVSATKPNKPRAVAAPLHQAVTRLQALNEGPVKKAELSAAVTTFLEVYALSQHALRLPPLEGALPQKLPEGIELDEQRVTLGRDAKGVYVGLVRRKGESAPN